jgi:hypothetical protein
MQHFNIFESSSLVSPAFPAFPKKKAKKKANKFLTGFAKGFWAMLFAA